MTKRLLWGVLAVVVAGGGIAAFAYTRFAQPEPVVTEDYKCTTCDARQAAKKRLSDYLQSQSE